jgi:hypothetical protein
MKTSIVIGIAFAISYITIFAISLPSELQKDVGLFNGTSIYAIGYIIGTALVALIPTAITGVVLYLKNKRKIPTTH